jgi:hypothetical protein
MRRKHASEPKPPLILLAVRVLGSAAQLKSGFYFFVALAKNLAGFLEARPLFYVQLTQLPAFSRAPSSACTEASYARIA